MFRCKLADFVVINCEKVFVVMFVVLFFMESDALAYLDPGTGSFFLQVIAASIVAVGFFARKFWSRITSLFTHKDINTDDGNKQ
jgi:hypothetical protein